MLAARQTPRGPARLEPRRLSAYDQKAHLLATLRRFEEAEETCRSPALGTPPPAMIRARACWLLAQKGQLSEAADQMKEVLEATPDNYWARLQLLDWLWALGLHVSALEQAQRLVELAPEASLAHYKLGEAYEAMNYLELARNAFRKALELDPSDENAAVRLFDMERAAGNSEAARGALARMSDQSPFVAARRVQLACAEGDREEARAHLAAALRQPDGNPWPRNTAQEALSKRGWRSDAIACAEAAVTARPDDVELARYLGRQQGVWLPLSGRMEWFKGLGAGGAAAVEAWIDAVGTRTRWALRMLVRRHGPWLRERASLWLAVGDALLMIGEVRRARGWLAGWRERTDTSARAYLVCATAALADRAFDEAAEAAQRGLEQPRDDARVSLLALDAWFAASGGRADEADERLRRAGAGSSAVEQFWVCLAQALVASCKGELQRAADCAKAAEAALPGFRGGSTTLPLWRATRLKIARSAGTLRAWIWWATGFLY